ncbi:MAG TPA: hypothetical protein VIC06_09020 [Solirubrobacteraceae bacterium]|jgi:hypothetical protein
MVRHRDHLVVKCMGEQYAARLDHLEALMGRRTMTTRNLVERLCETGHLRARHILVGECACTSSLGLPAHAGSASAS